MSHLPHTIPARGWTPELKARFLDRLAAHGNARAACRSVNLSAEAAYRLRRRDALFARGWAAALVLARENSEQVLGERAIEGVEEEIYYRGELIGTRRRFDSRLLLAHLARLDRLVEDGAANEDAGRFDELLACVVEDSANELPPEREDFAEDAARQASDILWARSLAEYRAINARDAESIRDEEADPYADSDDQEEEYEEEFLELVEEECREEADRARGEAERTWDLRLAQAFEAVDTACGRSAKSYGPPATAVAAVLAACPPSARMPGESRAFSLPRTLSTVSTCALARTLAEPLPGCSTTPRSPFDAPRNTAGR